MPEDVVFGVNKFAKCGKLAGDAASKAIRTLAFLIQGRAMEQLQLNGSIDTGALRASGYVQVGGEGGDARRQAVEAARLRFITRGIKSRALREVASFKSGSIEWVPEGQLEAKAAFTMHYAPYVEDAKPYLEPAINDARRRAPEIAKRIIADALRSL